MLMSALVAVSASAYTLDGPSADWTAVPYLTAPDYPDDESTGADEADLVGDPLHPAIYTAFDDAGTPSLTDGSLAFRMRLGTDENPDGFKHVAVIGLDVDQNAAIDILLVVDNKGGSPEVAIRPVDGSGDTPDDTAIDTDNGTSYAQSASNYSWLSVSAVDPGALDFDVDDDTEEDHFLSFEVPFQDLVSELAALGHAGFDETTLVTLVAGTSTNSKSINQDWSGANGDTNWDQSWSWLGAISEPMPVPEPNSGLLVGLGLVALAARRRRQRDR
jgi:hypothetical protein